MLLKVEVQKKEQNKFDNKLNIKDARWYNEISGELTRDDLVLGTC